MLRPILLSNPQRLGRSRRVRFESVPIPGSALNRRSLLVDERAVFDLGSCDTCPFWFTLLDDAAARPRSRHPRFARGPGMRVDEVIGRLRAGVDDLADPAVIELGRVLAPGHYRTLLTEVRPRRVEPLSADDYFATEQLEPWPIEGATEQPHDCGQAYYRSGQRRVSDKRGRVREGVVLFELLVPTRPPSGLDEAAVEQYTDELAHGSDAMAAAVSVLEVHVSEDTPIEPPPEHWVLAHYLLDGHHKIEAAARIGQPVRLLSFISEEHSMATPTEWLQFARTLRGR